MHRKDILSSLFSPLFSLLAIRPYDFPQPTTKESLPNHQQPKNPYRTTTNQQN
ncbi:MULTISPECIES: hypothetical protein [Planktothricoides]|uniref:Uncharacterized protein n=1 Tax=Planktothricoides raciborskii FACHB-1370 TaxID=2949576 RepID=A0ABR8EDH4_9CYAN|nr:MULTISPECIES: hypothetical protein [Planktothricoides]MBD2543646.1 hypothetical protein [Planktothricoides raciborskii FACHB-1370]MBD2582462.1 hypothetical protein [Planktothricoides raciborskii FACHB-1261]